MAERMTYLLVDGENIDATLGTSILGAAARRIDDSAEGSRDQLIRPD